MRVVWRIFFVTSETATGLLWKTSVKLYQSWRFHNIGFVIGWWTPFSWQNCEGAEGILVILLLSSLPYCSGEKEPLRAAANGRRGRCEASHLSTNQKQGRCQPYHLSSWPIGAADQLLLLLFGTNAVVLTKVCDHLCPCALVQPSVCQSVHTSSIYPFIHHSSIRLWVVFKF